MEIRVRLTPVGGKLSLHGLTGHGVVAETKLDFARVDFNHVGALPNYHTETRNKLIRPKSKRDEIA